MKNLDTFRHLWNRRRITKSAAALCGITGLSHRCNELQLFTNKKSEFMRFIQVYNITESGRD